METSQVDKKNDVEDLATAVLPDVEVTADAVPQRVYSRKEMDMTPQSNRDIASLIANNPAIRSTNENSGTGNKGSLAPESFSIHGESPYQNQFQIDGISATNVINPHAEASANGGQNDISSYSQSYNIDTDLIEEVHVFDNRVPVEFGRFAGGVIDARIKNPTGSRKWKVKQSFNSSNLTKQEMSPVTSQAVLNSWANGEVGYSSVWKKHFSSVIGDFPLTEDTNMLFSFSRRKSDITRMQKVLDPSANTIQKNDFISVASDQSDTVDNFLSKIHTRFDGADASLSLKYASRVEEMVNNHAQRLGMDWDYGQKSYGIGFDYFKPTVNGIFSVKLGFDQMNSIKNDNEKDLYTEKNAPGGGLYFHGGYGDIAEKQRQHSIKLRHDWSQINLGPVEYQLYAGVDYQAIKAIFERKQEHNQYTYDHALGGTLQTHHVYHAGTSEAEQESLAFYLSNTISWKNIELMLATRWDRDDLLGRTNFSPRAGIDWDLNGDSVSKIGLGWSRYYGMDIIGYALEEQKYKMWDKIYDAGNNYVIKRESHNFNNLKTPYSDEWAFSFSREINSLVEAKVQYIHRTGRDAVALEKYDSAIGHNYVNKGRSKTETLIFGLHSKGGLKLVGADWRLGFDFSWQDSVRNYQSNSSYEAYAGDDDDIITVDNVRMKRKDKPVSEFSLPRKVSASWSANWSSLGVKWGNRLNWGSSRKGIALIAAGDGSSGSEKYQTKRLPSNWTWDTSFQFQPRSLKGFAFNVDILNVLNQIRPTSVVASASGTMRMQVGREIWLNSSYEF